MNPLLHAPTSLSTCILLSRVRSFTIKDDHVELQVTCLSNDGTGQEIDYIIVETPSCMLWWQMYRRTILEQAVPPIPPTISS